MLRLVRREPTGTDEIRWDPAAGELDASRLQGVDAIVNLSGENLGKRWTDARKREILDSRVQSTELLASDGSRARTPSAVVRLRRRRRHLRRPR